MEQKYAIIAKKIALFSGLVACIVCFTLLYTIVSKEKEPDVSFACGTSQYSHGSGRSGLQTAKMIFNNNCAQCHNKNMKEPMTGPALYFWRNHFKDETALLAFLKDSRTYIKKTKNRALKELDSEYSGVECPNFPELTPLNVKNLVQYIGNVNY
jgi:hypothetical protein